MTFMDFQTNTTKIKLKSFNRIMFFIYRIIYGTNIDDIYVTRDL